MAILATQSILTLDGWKKAHDIRKGDILFNHKGQPTTVTLVQEYRSENCHRVNLNDHLGVEGDNNLTLALESRQYRKHVDRYKGVQKFKRPLQYLNLDNLFETGLLGQRGRKEYSIPSAEPLQLPNQPLSIPPFVLGFWLYAENKNQTMTIFPDRQDVVFEKFKDAGYELTPASKTLPRFWCEPNIRNQLIGNVPISIPINYLMSSPEQRTELLSGIIHAHKHAFVIEKRQFRFNHRNPTHLRPLQFLAESIGCRTLFMYDKTNKNHNLYIRTKIKFVPEQPDFIKKPTQTRRFVVDIQPLPPQLVVHIETDSEERTFLVGEGFIACR